MLLWGGRRQLLDRLARNYSGPEVGFGEIAIDFLQARFWIASGLGMTRRESIGLAARLGNGVNSRCLMLSCAAGKPLFGQGATSA